MNHKPKANMRITQIICNSYILNIRRKFVLSVIKMDRDKEEFQHDWYAILGCDVGSSIEVIQKAARKLSVKYHPDKTTDPTAPEKFLLIQKAKDILSDEGRKKIIDDYYTTVKQREQYEVQRNKAMDDRRKRFRDDLEQRVEEAKSLKKAKPSETAHEDILTHELAKNSKVLSALRKENESIIEQAREEARRRQTKKNEDFVAYSRQLASEVGSADNVQCAIKIKWRKSLGDTMTADRLSLMFSIYGVIEDIGLDKEKKSTAIIYFTTGNAARAAIDAFATNEDFRVSFLHSQQTPANPTANPTVFTNSSAINEAVQNELSQMKRATERDNVLNPFRVPSAFFATSPAAGGAVGGGTASAPTDAPLPTPPLPSNNGTSTSLATKEQDVLKKMMEAAAAKKQKHEAAVVAPPTAADLSHS